MGVIEYLIYKRKHRAARELLLLIANLDVPAAVKIGHDLLIQHRGMGTVIHPLTRIGNRVTVYHQVTIGRADAHIPMHLSEMEHIEIGDDVVLYPGAKVLGGPGVTRIGTGTIIAANAVLTSSTGDWEVWGGVPAKRLKSRLPPEAHSGSMST
jgi:serine O-acetyltransferase